MPNLDFGHQNKCQRRVVQILQIVSRPSQTEGQRALSAIYENRGNFGFMHENFGKGRVIFRAGYIPTENGSKRKILACPVFN